MQRIGIIGAGMAGLSLAARLVAAGKTCTILEKSRGAGGRMATRRNGDLRFDHGAPGFSTTEPAFAATVDGWAAAGHAVRWTDIEWVGMPAMTTPPRTLAGTLTIVAHQTVAQMRRGRDGWRVSTAEGGGFGPFDTLLLAIPAPQAVALAGNAAPQVTDRLRDPVYAPCWTMMVAFQGACGWPGPLERWTDESLALAVRDDLKPGRAGPERLVVHAAPTWSRRMLEHDAPVIAQRLWSDTRRALGIGIDPAHLSAHRWRYATVETALGAPCIWDADLGLGAAGDWALGTGVEGAWLSGRALADAVLGA